MTKKLFLFALTIPMIFNYGCQSNSSSSSSSKTNESNDEKSLNSECDCKKHAVDLKLKLPESSDLFRLMDSTSGDGDFTEYRKIQANVNSIRKNYDLTFKKCTEKFGEFNVINAACTPEEKTRKAFNTALNLIQRKCQGSNQTLSKYMATKVNGNIVFMFISVAENGMACITGVSEISPEEILSSDCGNVDRKVADWEAITEYKINLQ
jgi:hypothetical protein